MYFEEEYQVGVRYWCNYNLLKDDKYWKVEGECRFIDWLPLLLPFDDVYRISLRNLIIRDAFAVSKEILHELALSGMEENIYYNELSKLLRYPVIAGVRIYRYLLKEEKKELDANKEEFLVGKVKEEVQTAISRIINAPLVKVSHERVYFANEDQFIIEEIRTSKNSKSRVEIEEIFDMYDIVQGRNDVLERHLEETIKLLSFDGAPDSLQEDFKDCERICTKIYKELTKRVTTTIDST